MLSSKLEAKVLVLYMFFIVQYGIAKSSTIGTYAWSTWSKSPEKIIQQSLTSYTDGSKVDGSTGTGIHFKP